MALDRFAIDRPDRLRKTAAERGWPSPASVASRARDRTHRTISLRYTATAQGAADRHGDERQSRECLAYSRVARTRALRGAQHGFRIVGRLGSTHRTVVHRSEKDRRAESFLEPHGVGALTGRLADWNLPYAITGPFASAELAPAAMPIAIDVYVRDIEEAREALSLRRSERIGNVRLIEAFDRVVFERTMTTNENLTLASPTQIAADSWTLPKRSSDEYLKLIDWMKRNESTWRR